MPGQLDRSGLEGIGWARAKDDAARLARIYEECERGFEVLHDVEPAVDPARGGQRAFHAAVEDGQPAQPQQ